MSIRVRIEVGVFDLRMASVRTGIWLLESLSFSLILSSIWHRGYKKSTLGLSILSNLTFEIKIKSHWINGINYSMFISF